LVEQGDELVLGRIRLDAMHVAARPCMRHHHANTIDQLAPPCWQRREKRHRACAQVAPRDVSSERDRPAIVIAADRRDAPLAQQRQGLIGKQSAIDEVTATQHTIDPDAIELRQRIAKRVDIRMDIRDHPDLRHVQVSRRLYNTSQYSEPLQRAQRYRVKPIRTCWSRRGDESRYERTWGWRGSGLIAAGGSICVVTARSWRARSMPRGCGSWGAGRRVSWPRRRPGRPGNRGRG